MAGTGDNANILNTINAGRFKAEDPSSSELSHVHSPIGRESRRPRCLSSVNRRQ